MPFCTACGKQNPDDARFCSQCGTRLVTPEAAPTEPPTGESTETITFGVAREKADTSDRQLSPVDAAAVDARLKARNILVRNFHGSHPLLANCLRLTVGTPGENELLLSALAESV